MSTNSVIAKYPLDLTAVNPNNWIPNEPHELSPGLNRSAIPTYGAFYVESLVVVDAATGLQLKINDDYIPILYVARASERSGKEVCSGVVITNGAVSNNVLLSMQMVGGEFSSFVPVILDLISNLNLDDRSIVYGDLLGRPSLFTPGEHLHDIGDIYGFEFLVDALHRVREAILYGDVESHNEIIASINARYQSLQEALDSLDKSLSDDLKEHADNENNPHKVNKLQVGLGHVENLQLANKSHVESETDLTNERYMTPLRSIEMLLWRMKAAGDTGVGGVRYNGATRLAGMFYSSASDSTNPTSTDILKYDGNFYATKFFGDGGGLVDVLASKIKGGTNEKLNSDVYDFASSAEATNTGSNPNATKPLNTQRTHAAILARAIGAGSEVVGSVRYNGNTRLGGRFYGGTTNPRSTTRLNYDGDLTVRRLWVTREDAEGGEEFTRTQVYSLYNLPPNANNGRDGYLSKENHKLLTDASSTIPSGSTPKDTLVRRDAEGNITVNEMTGNASSATKLKNKRKINGTDFDGTGDITTETWGTSRKVKVGFSELDVNGSKDVSFSHSEMGTLRTTRTKTEIVNNTSIVLFEHDGGNLCNLLISINHDTHISSTFLININKFTSGIATISQLNHLDRFNIGLRVTVNRLSNSKVHVQLNATSNSTTRVIDVSITELTSSGTVVLLGTPRAGDGVRYVVGQTTNLVGSFNLGGDTNGISAHHSLMSDVSAKLKDKRKINGTDFDGTGDITTETWGTSRKVKVGFSEKDVNGSEDVSFSHSEMGTLRTHHYRTELRGTLASELCRIPQDRTCVFILNIQGVGINHQGNLHASALVTLGHAEQLIQLNHGRSSDSNRIDLILSAETLSNERVIQLKTIRHSGSLLPFSNNITIDVSITELNPSQLSLISLPPVADGGIRYRNRTHGTAVREMTFINNAGLVASSALRLNTSRKINGTDFNGGLDITTETWGTSRKVKVGFSEKDVNGNSDYDYTHKDIGTLQTNYLKTELRSNAYTVLCRYQDTSTCNLLLSVRHNSGVDRISSTFIINVDLITSSQLCTITQLNHLDSLNLGLEVLVRRIDNTTGVIQIRASNSNPVNRVIDASITELTSTGTVELLGTENSNGIRYTAGITNNTISTLSLQNGGLIADRAKKVDWDDIEGKPPVDVLTIGNFEIRNNSNADALEFNYKG